MKLSELDPCWNRYRFLTGSYTQEDLVPGSKGEGVRLWELDSTTGSIEPVTSFADVSNPSWIAVHPSGTHAAVASEHVGGASRVCLLKLDTDGTLRLTDMVPAGSATCHVAFSPDGHLLASAAYVGGQVQLMQVNEDRFRGGLSTFNYSGRGPNAERQEAPHAHQVVFRPDGQFLYVTDLGSDRIWGHQIDGGNVGVPAISTQLPAGEGPRHMAVDWKRREAYVLAELTGKVHHLSIDPASGRFTVHESLSSLPDDWTGNPSSAAIRLHPAHPVLYVSNRNSGLITGFRTATSGGGLERIGMWATDDPCPRDFNISPDGRWLLVAGQERHRIDVHPIDQESGEIGPAVHGAGCGSPVCLAWVPQ